MLSKILPFILIISVQTCYSMDCQHANYDEKYNTPKKYTQPIDYGSSDYKHFKQHHYINNENDENCNTMNNMTYKKKLFPADNNKSNSSALLNSPEESKYFNKNDILMKTNEKKNNKIYNNIDTNTTNDKTAGKTTLHDKLKNSDELKNSNELKNSDEKINKNLDISFQNIKK